jgi:hypothetical protein
LAVLNLKINLKIFVVMLVGIAGGNCCWELLVGIAAGNCWWELLAAIGGSAIAMIVGGECPPLRERRGLANWISLAQRTIILDGLLLNTFATN